MLVSGYYQRHKNTTSDSKNLTRQGRQMKRILTGLFMAAALSAPALAADMAPSYKAPAYAPAANWTGLYLGVNGGGGILNGDFLDQDCNECANTTIHTGFGTFGGQIGYNWQLSNFVLGL